VILLGGCLIGVLAEEVFLLFVYLPEMKDIFPSTLFESILVLDCNILLWMRSALILLTEPSDCLAPCSYRHSILFMRNFIFDLS
jgi:hypothetical protein